MDGSGELIPPPPYPNPRPARQSACPARLEWPDRWDPISFLFLLSWFLSFSVRKQPCKCRCAPGPREGVLELRRQYSRQCEARAATHITTERLSAFRFPVPHPNEDPRYPALLPHKVGHSVGPRCDKCTMVNARIRLVPTPAKSVTNDSANATHRRKKPSGFALGEADCFHSPAQTLPPGLSRSS